MIRIVSDGLSSKSLRVIDAETGLELKGIMKVEILIEPGEVNKAVLTVALGSMDLQADEGYVSAHQADVYVGARLEELPAVFSVATAPEPEVSPAEDLAAVFSLESLGGTQEEHFNYALPAGFFKATTDQVAESAQRWERIQRLLLGCENAVAKLDAKPASAPGTSTPAGLAVDGGYKGLRG